MVVIKKYSNRRLYDTGLSRYVTLEEVSERIRSGTDVGVVDAKTGADLTQATLTQIILETRAALLPAPLLTRLIRMSDDSLAEFFGRYMTWALEMYMHARRGAQAVQPYNPLANVPFAASNALARLFMGGSPWSEGAPLEAAASAAPPPPPPPPAMSDVDELRREIDELRQSMQKRPRRRG